MYITRRRSTALVCRARSPAPIATPAPHHPHVHDASRGAGRPASIADPRLADGELLDMMKLSDLRWNTTLHFAPRYTAVSDLEPTADGAPALCGEWVSFVAETDEVFTLDGSCPTLLVDSPTGTSSPSRSVDSARPEFSLVVEECHRTSAVEGASRRVGSSYGLGSRGRDSSWCDGRDAPCEARDVDRDVGGRGRTTAELSAAVEIGRTVHSG
jgi:hypothetical protein